MSPTSMEELEITLKNNSNALFIEPGGRYKPPGCLSNHRIAIIIPFRNREEHLLLFLQHMHPFLQRQQIEYGIFVVEQSGFSNMHSLEYYNFNIEPLTHYFRYITLQQSGIDEYWGYRSSESNISSIPVLHLP